MMLERAFFQTRGARTTLWWTAGLAAVAWVVLASADNDCVELLAKTIVPLGAAIGIGVAARSPFGEVEIATGALLPRLRSTHLIGLLAVGMLCLAIAGLGDADGWSTAMLIRNLAGFTGLALLIGAYIGAAWAWLIPFVYGSIAFLAAMPDDRAGAWAWPVRPGDHLGAAIAAAAMLLSGLVAARRHGVRPD